MTRRLCDDAYFCFRQAMEKKIIQCNQISLLKGWLPENQIVGKMKIAINLFLVGPLE